MSMKKGHMMELIQRLIHDAAVEQLKKKKARSPHDPPDMSDDELDKILFYGGMERLSESFDKVPKISSSDITGFEQEMSNIVSNIPNAVLSFDRQPNGYSILLKNGGQQVNVVASGKITFGNEGTMTWMFSIPNGMRISTNGLEITQSNRDMVSDMANYYNTWQKDWRQKLIAPDGGASEQEPSADAFKAPAGAPAQVGAPPATSSDASQGASPAGI